MRRRLVEVPAGRPDQPRESLRWLRRARDLRLELRPPAALLSRRDHSLYVPLPVDHRFVVVHVLTQCPRLQVVALPASVLLMLAFL